MKLNYAALLMALVLTAPAVNLMAQDADQPQPRRPRPEQRDGETPRERPRGPRPDGQGPDGQKPPVPPLIAALDANHDGVIDEKEIANASEALKKLDKNGDGKIQMEELRPKRPQGDGPDGQRPQHDGEGPGPKRRQPAPQSDQ